MMAYCLEFPPWEEVHARRLQESAEDFAELLTAHAHVSDAKVARSAFAIRVAVHAPALARTRPANVELIGDVVRAWQGVAKAAAASRAMAVRAEQRLAQQQQLDEELRRKIVACSEGTCKYIKTYSQWLHPCLTGVANLRAGADR